MDELLLTMDGETEQYEKLIGLSDKKKDSIIYKKLDVLEAITAEEQAIEISGFVVFDGKDAATSQTGRLGQDVALFFDLLLGEVIDDLGLRAVGRKTLVFTMVLLDGEQKGNGFVDFAAILTAAAGEYYCKFFHGFLSRIREFEIILLKIVGI
jgi:hypothetical protein